MLSTIGRAAIKRIGGSHISTNRILATIWQLQRVEGQQNVESSLGSLSASSLARRLYATASKATQTKPTTSKKPATKAVSAKKTAAKKPAAKKPAREVAKKKPAAKKPVKKAKAKAKPKPKLKPKKKVVLTPSQIVRKKIRELKVTALIGKEPAIKPNSAFQILLQENSKSVKNIIENVRQTAVQLKSLSTAEFERLDRIAKENIAANAAANQRWVETYTPNEIRLANSARLAIRHLTNKKTPTALHDVRSVTRPAPALTLFVKARFASGDFKGLSMPEAIKRIAMEFKELSPEQREPYNKAASEDRNRYIQEYKTVYKEDTYTGKIRAKTRA